VNIIRMIRRERDVDRWEADVKASAAAWKREMEFRCHAIACRPSWIDAATWESSIESVRRGDPLPLPDDFDAIFPQAHNSEPAE